MVRHQSLNTVVQQLKWVLVCGKSLVKITKDGKGGKGGQFQNKSRVDKNGVGGRGINIPGKMYLAVLTNTSTALISLVAISEH